MTSFRSRLSELHEDLGIEPLHDTLTNILPDSERNKFVDISPPFSCLSGFLSSSEHETPCKDSIKYTLKERKYKQLLPRDYSIKIHHCLAYSPSHCAYTRALDQNRAFVMQEIFIYTMESSLPCDTIICGIPTIM